MILTKKTVSTTRAVTTKHTATKKMVAKKRVTNKKEWKRVYLMIAPNINVNMFFKVYYQSLLLLM